MDRRQFLIGVGAVTLLPRPAFSIATNYPLAMKNVLVHEGGYSNHPADPGGVTLNGVIQTRYDQYRRDHGLPQKALTRAMARDPEWHRERDAIYRQYYADPMRFDELPLGLDYTVFDYAVNSGIGRSGKILRQVLKLPTDTWRVTPLVLEEVARDAAVRLINAINAERVRFLNNLMAARPSMRVFRTGWMRRVNFVRVHSLNMAGVSAAYSTSSGRLPGAAPSLGKAIYGLEDMDDVQP